MTNEERREYVNYRIESAHKTIDAAKVLAENGFWNSAVNRLYYAVYYAVNALLVFNEIQTKSHSATKSQFSLYFVKTGKFDKKYGRYCQSCSIGDKREIMKTCLTTIVNWLSPCFNLP